MSPPSILYIEDEPDYQTLVARILGEAGLVTDVADTGAEGMHKLARQRPSLLLLDINLPDTNGYLLCSRIRQDESWSELPILMLTVRRRPEEWLEGFSRGADDYLSKPFNPPELIERVQSCLNGKPPLRLTSDKPEHLLIEAALAGNRSAFEVLITKYREPLYKSLMSKVANVSEAEDILAATFMEAYECLRSFQGHSSFSTWLHAIAKHQFHRKWRQLNTVPLDDMKEEDQLDQLASDGLMISDALEKSEKRAAANRLESALWQVPTHHRKALELFYVQGLPYDSIARRLNIPRGTVMSRLARGKDQLKKAWNSLSCMAHR
jgi:RNA polymerase sigma factor (sigma-70 family)